MGFYFIDERRVGLFMAQNVLGDEINGIACCNSRQQGSWGVHVMIV